jgi:hypothetical protein
MASPAQEDALLRQILAVTLDPAAAKGSSGDAPVVYLAGLAQVRPGGAWGARGAPSAVTLHAQRMRAGPHG